jgi:hypothetical protein
MGNAQLIFMIKMKKFLIMVVLLARMTGQLFAQSFSLYYSTSVDEYPSDVVYDSAGNYYVSLLHGTFNYDSYFQGKVLKVSGSGQITDSLILFSNGGTKYISKLMMLSDGSIMGFGSIRLFGTSDIQAYIIRFNQNLQIQYEKVYGDSLFHEYPQQAILIEPNLIHIVNSISSNAPAPVTDDGICILTINLNGDSTGSHVYNPNSGFQRAFDILVQPDKMGLYLFSYGWPVSPPLSGLRTEILSIDTNWTITDTTFLENIYYNVKAKYLDNSSFIASARTRDTTSFSSFGHQIGIVTYDSLLIRKSYNIYGKKDTTEIECQHGLDFTDTSSVYVGGTSNFELPYYFSNWKSWYYLIKCNSKGEKIWERWYNLNDNYLTLWKVLATKDGGVLLAGTSYNSQTAAGQERDLYILKLDSLGNLVTSVPGINVQPAEIKIFPNPFTTTLRIQTSLTTPADYAIHDVAGRLLSGGVLKNTSDSEIDLSATPSGVYFITLSTGGRPIARQRVVKE